MSSLYSLKNASGQIAWVGDSVIGHSIDPITKKIDTTEGFGAFDSVFKIPYAVSGKAIDVGGGSSDINGAYIAQKHLVDCVVYDPYMRGDLHNKKILKMAKSHPPNTTFSLSVLNVISDPESRKSHLKLCLRLLKLGGKAIFKVWPGDASGQGKVTTSGYQSNRDIESYLSEIAAIFGRDMVRFDPDQKAVICISNRDMYPSGSVCL